MRRYTWVVLGALMLVTPVSGQEWRSYQDPTLGFSIALPPGFRSALRENDPAEVRLVDGEAELTVFGGSNAEGWSAEAFADFVGQADRIEEVTYRRVGGSWFVLSGFYRREGSERDDLIFYTKFMLSSDRSRFAGFEISYPAADKRAMDDVVERLEGSFTPPR